MAEQEQEQNRSEPATPFKLAEARKQGQVAKSLDFNAVVGVGALLLLMSVWGGRAAERLARLSSWLLLDAAALRLEVPADAVWLRGLLAAFLAIVLPICVVGLACAVLSNLVQTGPIFSFTPLQPKFERINPVAGFKRLFSKRMLFEGAKTLLKIAIFAAVLYGFAVSLWPTLPELASREPGAQLGWLAERASTLLLRLGLAMLMIALLDLFYVRWQYRRQMMMSRRELQQEIKRREGDPLIRAKLRDLQRENLKQARSLSRVPEADVLITNPEHVAIALRYSSDEMSAPQVIAKGADDWALRMKELARRHGIAIFERRKLARRLFRQGQVDRAIPPDTYLEVARVYADLEAARRGLARYEIAR
jgi:flagellar biosynthetic protein FlhB